VLRVCGSTVGIVPSCPLHRRSDRLLLGMNVPLRNAHIPGPWRTDENPSIAKHCRFAQHLPEGLSCSKNIGLADYPAWRDNCLSSGGRKEELSST
jgi:hypothetical protein